MNEGFDRTDWYRYLDDPSCEPLSDEEIRELHDQETPEARETIILSALRAAFKSATMFRHAGHPEFDDMVGCAHIGLIEAVDSWKPEEYSFFPYILLHMRKAIIMQLRRTIIKIPTAAVWKGLNALKDLEQQFKECTISELADLLFKSKRQIFTILAAKAATNVQLCGKMDNAAENMRNNFYRLPVGEHQTMCLAAVEKILHLAIEDETRREMFEKRFGLKGHPAHTKTQLMEEYDASVHVVEYNSAACIRELKNWFDPDFMKEVPCQHCGKMYVPSHGSRGHQKYCSPECNEIVQAERKKVIQQPKVCALDGCDVVFTPKRKSTIYCCSDHTLKAARAAAKKRRQAEPKPVCVCEWCKKEFTPKRGNGKGRYGKICPVCYPEYRKEWRKRHQREKYREKNGLCITCGMPIPEDSQYCEEHTNKPKSDWSPEREKVFNYLSEVLENMACA